MLDVGCRMLDVGCLMLVSYLEIGFTYVNLFQDKTPTNLIRNPRLNGSILDHENDSLYFGIFMKGVVAGF